MYEYFDEMENGSFLEHHGILGQKWGIRRFQNYDGTLKAAGKRRAKTDRDKERAERKKARAEKKEAKAQAKAEKAKAELDAAKKRAIANADLNEIMKLRGSMTTDELKEASARALAIGQVNKNMPKEKSKIDKVIDTLGTGKKAIDAIAGAHQSLQALRKEFGLDMKSVLNDSDDGQMTIGDWMNNKDPDIFDRIKSATGKIAKDAANKASEAYQQKKTEKQLKEASDRIKDNETLNWLENLNDGKKENSQPKANFDRGFKLKDGDYDTATGKSVGKFIDKLGSVGDVTNKERSYNKGAYSQQQLRDSVSGHGKIDRGFRLGDGDYSIFSSSAMREKKVSDLPKPRNITLPKGSGSKPISEVLKDLDDLTSDLSDNNKRRLGL